MVSETLSREPRMPRLRIGPPIVDGFGMCGGLAVERTLATARERRTYRLDHCSAGSKPDALCGCFSCEPSRSRPCGGSQPRYRISLW